MGAYLRMIFIYCVIKIIINWDYVYNITSFVTEEDATENVLSYELLYFCSKSSQVV